mgnify:CR=1 FL=1
MNIFLLTKIVNRKGKIVRTKSHRYIMPIFLNPSRANMRDGIVLNASAVFQSANTPLQFSPVTQSLSLAARKKTALQKEQASQSNLSGEKTNTLSKKLV